MSPWGVTLLHNEVLLWILSVCSVDMSPLSFKHLFHGVCTSCSKVNGMIRQALQCCSQRLIIRHGFFLFFFFLPCSVRGTQMSCIAKTIREEVENHNCFVSDRQKGRFTLIHALYFPYGLTPRVVFGTELRHVL